MKTLALLICVSTTAFARPTAKTPVDPKTVEARAHHQEGLAHFNLQEYDAAIEEFEAAYRLRPDPVFLYNLAQSHRLAERPERALYFYRAYLRAAGDKTQNRREVERRVNDLEKLLADKHELTTPPDHALEPSEPPASVTVENPAPAPALDLRAPVPPPKKTVYKKWWLWTTVGLIAAGAAVGIGVGITESGPKFDANLGTLQPAVK